MSFETFLLDHESVIRFGFFLGTFALMALWEVLAPLRVPGTSKAVRWPNHVMLAAMNVVLVRVLFPLAAVALAVYAGERGHRTLQHDSDPVPLGICRVAAGARSGDLLVPSAVSRRAGALACAPGTSRGPRHRRQHRGAISSDPDGAVRNRQVHRHLAAGPTGTIGVDLRGPVSCHYAVQPRECEDSCLRWTACCAGSS